MRQRVIGLVALVLVVCVSAGCSGGTGSPSIKASRGEKVVSYHGVHVIVPSSWPVVDGMHTDGLCEGPFPATPTAFVGAYLGRAPTCPAVIGAEPRHDGVWLQPGARQPGATRLRTASGQAVYYEGYSNDVKSYFYHRVSIEIGIGPNPHVATAIFESIGFTAHEADTKALGVCAMSKDPDAMPVPKRLTKALVLDEGNFDLEPPLSSDRPAVSAAAIWRKTLPEEPFERYELLLTRFSAKLPARLTNGTLVPLNHNILAWVVYSLSLSPSIPGCGGTGEDVFDATTGQQIIASFGY